MKNFIDIKHTIWQRYHFKDDADMKKVISTIENNEDFLTEELGFKSSEDLSETLDSISVEDNKGNSTIEVYTEDSNDDVLWDNVDKYNQ